MAVTKWSIGRNKQRPYAISLNESALSKEAKMPRKATTALAALLVFGAASVVWADANSRTDGSFAQRPVSIGAVNDAAKSFNTEDRASFAASQLAPARGGTTGRMTAWIKLTEPGGKPIHINVQHVTSVRSDTQNPWSQGSTRFDEREISGRAGKR
jgi:hypothetical protein